MRRLSLLFIFALVSCKTHQFILDQGGLLPFKETAQSQKNEIVEISNLSSIQRRIDRLERDSVNKQEFDEAVESLKKELQRIMTELEKNKKTKTVQEISKKEDLFAQAEKHFKDKKWKDAILTYEEFRSQEPQSPLFKEATLKIGKSFLDLGYPQEARVFFEEVVTRFPNSKEAQEAQKALNSQKK